MKITCDKLTGGGAPRDQNRDIHLTFSGPRLQRGCRRYVTITKSRSASLRSAIIVTCVERATLLRANTTRIVREYKAGEGVPLLFTIDKLMSGSCLEGKTF